MARSQVADGEPDCSRITGGLLVLIKWVGLWHLSEENKVLSTCLNMKMEIKNGVTFTVVGLYQVLIQNLLSFVNWIKDNLQPVFAPHPISQQR